jgi:hypothetical protein
MGRPIIRDALLRKGCASFKGVSEFPQSPAGQGLLLAQRLASKRCKRERSSSRAVGPGPWELTSHNQDGLYQGNGRTSGAVCLERFNVRFWQREGEIPPRDSTQAPITAVQPQCCSPQSADIA